MEELEIKTYFTVHQKQFPKLDNLKINTLEFLEASRGIVGLIEKFGKALAAARYDVNRNVEKLTKKYYEDPDKYTYLEDIILFEKQEGRIFATEALMWLRRSLHFLLDFFEGIINDDAQSEDLTIILKTAYCNTLEKHQNFIGNSLFNVVIKLIPQRTEFLKSIALENKDCEEYVLKDAQIFIINLKICVEHLIEFYKVHNLER